MNHTTTVHPGTSQNPLPAAAEAYATRGWRVIPLWWPTTTGNVPVCACPKGAACGRNTGKHPIIGFFALPLEKVYSRNYTSQDD